MIDEYKKKRDKEVEELKAENLKLTMKLQKKEKEVESLGNSLLATRKENKGLVGRIETDIDPSQKYVRTQTNSILEGRAHPVQSRERRTQERNCWVEE